MRLQAQTDPNPPAGSESLGHAAPLSERHPAVQERMEARVHLQKTRQRDRGLLLVRLKFTQLGGNRLSRASPLELMSWVLHPRLCRRYVNALEAASENFATNIDREMLRGKDELQKAFELSKRHSNSGSL